MLERENFGTINRSSPKHSAEGGVSWYDRAIRADTPVIRRVSLTVKHSSLLYFTGFYKLGLDSEGGREGEGMNPEN